jgi:hypothetical protein
MNQKANKYFSKVESVYDIKLGRYNKCPICGKEGQPMKDNEFIMEHRVADAKAIVYHRWSYSTGRKVDLQAENSNDL